MTTLEEYVEDRPPWPGGPAGRPPRPTPRHGRGSPPSPRARPRRSPPPSPSDRLRARDLRALREGLERGDPPAHSSARSARAAAAGKGTTRRARHTRSAAPPPETRQALRSAKIVLVVVSALVLGLTGFGWTTFRSLQNGLATADVTGLTAPDGATDILLVGNDSRTDAQGNPLPEEVLRELGASDDEGGDLTDTMILVRIPNNGRRAVAISLPRDLDVPMPDGYGRHKLNSAFARAKNDTVAKLLEQQVAPERVRTQSIAAGRRLMVETIENLTGAGVDHYAELNLLGFARLTEAVGGVQVCLRAPVDDEFSGADFPAGLQTISGRDALAFVRQRHGLPRGDLDRVVRQQVFLAGLADTVLSAGTLANPGRISDLIAATQQALVLDDDLDVLDFAGRMRGVASGDVSFRTIPVLGEAESEADGAVLEADPRAVRRFVAGVIEPAPEAPVEAAVTVDVLNASSVTGLAAGVSGLLAGKGFALGSVGNAEGTQTSAVRHAPSDEGAAEPVAAALGGLPLAVDGTLAPGTARVYLGEDYEGPGGETTAAAPVAAGITAPQQAPPAPPPITAGEVPCVD